MAWVYSYMYISFWLTDITCLICETHSLNEQKSKKPIKWVPVVNIYNNQKVLLVQKIVLWKYMHYNFEFEISLNDKVKNIY